MTQSLSISATRNLRQIWLIRTGCVLFAGGLILGAYWLGQIQAGYDQFDSISRMARLHAEIHTLTTAKTLLSQRIARDTELLRLNALAHEATLRRLGAVEGELLTLRERLDFYRGLVAPARVARNLRIQGLAIIRSGANQFLYRLVLIATHTLLHPIEGEVELTVVGEGNGRHQVLSLRNLEPNSQDPLPFTFRSYEDLVGHLELPPGFKPAAVHIAILVSGHPHPVLSQTFDWPIFLS
ncbi:MAG: DUF6776 family protein [Gammaproteobacteria bacterium]